MAFHKWPYTNIHELNLDWILEQLKEFASELESFQVYLPKFSEHNESLWDIGYAYTPNTMVVYDGAVYIAKTNVPAGKEINDSNYWVKITDINPDYGQIEEHIEELLLSDRFIFPENFGAVGDGVTDDTEAIQKMLDSLLLPINERKIGAFGGKAYKITDTLRYRIEANRPLYLFGSTIITDENITMLHLGYNPQGVDGLTQNSVIGPGTFNMNAIATIGIYCDDRLDSAILENLFIKNVPANAKGIYAPNTARSAKNIYNNIVVWGIWGGQNFLNNVGIDLQAWDAQLCNIQTYNLSIGIRSAGGITLLNHHHWNNMNNFTNLNDYHRTHALEIYRGQATNMYYDCGVGVYVTSNNVVSITNIHKEVNTKENRDWFTKTAMVSIINKYSPLILEGYYWAPHGINPDLITVENRSEIYNLLGITSKIKRPTPAIRTGLAAIQPVTIANRITNGEMYFPFGAVSSQSVSANYYLLGYVTNNRTYTGRLLLTLFYNNNTNTLDIVCGQTPRLISKNGSTTTPGAIVFGQSTMINNTTVYPVYYQPGYDEGVFAAYAALSIKVDTTGVTDFYPVETSSPLTETIGVETVDEKFTVKIAPEQ